MAHRDDPTRRASVAMQILGDSGLELLPLLSGGAAGLSEMRNEARELGATVSTSSAAMGAQFGDAVTRIKTATDGIKNTFLNALTHILIDVADRLKNVLSFVSTMTRRFPTATSAIAGAAYAVKGLTTTAQALGVALKFITAANPAVLALTATITAAGVAAAFYFSKKRDENVWTDEKQKILEMGEERRRQDMESFHRLEELAAKESLTTAEIAEAARLASILKDTYGEIGVSVDTLTGKINIANGA